MNRTVINLPNGLSVIETRYDGDLTEISVYRMDPRKLMAVVTRQIKGGKWFVHTAERSRDSRWRVKKMAVARAVEYAESAP